MAKQRAQGDLAAEKVGFAYGTRPILSDVDLTLARGGFYGILGPNGSGKTTLLRLLTRALAPTHGRVTLDGRDLSRWPRRELARRMAVVAQDVPTDFEFSVAAMVLMGRFPHLRRFAAEGPRDLAIARQAMTRCGVLHLAERPWRTLSGGERQRAAIARALSQQPEILLLDEPTAHLDIHHQVEVLDLCRSLSDDGVTVVAVLHDLNLAALYCDTMALLHAGGLCAVGPPATVLTAAGVRTVYGGEVLVTRHPVAGVPQVVLLGSRLSRPEPRPERGRVHVIAGGGAAGALLAALVAAGYQVSTGVLNAGDDDWEAARALQVQVLDVPPFSPIDAAAAERLRAALAAVDHVVVAAVPLGPGNVGNLQAVAAAVDPGRVVLVGADAVQGRDFSGGEGQRLYRALGRAGARLAADYTEVLQLLGDG